MKDGVRHLVARLSDAWGALWGGVPAGRVYAYEARLDAGRSASTRRLSFERIEAILDSARSGYITEALEMFAEMEARDARLKSVAAIRRLALTGLDYEILSAAEGGAGMVDKSLADEAAAYVRETLSDLGGQFAQALEHLATAIGPNLAVLEMVWENARPIALVAIPNHRLTMDLQKSPHVRVITAGNAQGIETDGAKWVVHVPHAISGSPIDRSLAIAQVWIWLIKKLSLSDWATFCELFGMPLRIGKYRPAASLDRPGALRHTLRDRTSAKCRQRTKIEKLANRQTSPPTFCGGGAPGSRACAARRGRKATGLRLDSRAAEPVEMAELPNQGSSAFFFLAA